MKQEHTEEGSRASHGLCVVHRDGDDARGMSESQLDTFAADLRRSEGSRDRGDAWKPLELDGTG